MKRKHYFLMCLLLALIVALGHFVSCAMVHGHVAEATCSKATWQADRMTIQTDACPQSRHLEHGSSGIDGGQGRRWTPSSIALVYQGRTTSHELLAASEQRLRQQSVGQQAPLQVLQCSWLI